MEGSDFAALSSLGAAGQRPLPRRAADRAPSGVVGPRAVPRAGRLSRGNLRRLRFGRPHDLLQVGFFFVFVCTGVAFHRLFRERKLSSQLPSRLTQNQLDK